MSAFYESTTLTNVGAVSVPYRQAVLSILLPSDISLFTCLYLTFAYSLFAI